MTWHKSRLMGSTAGQIDPSTITYTNPSAALLKDQYLLEYSAKFQDLKKAFFLMYKDEADQKLSQFVYENAMQILRNYISNFINELERLRSLSAANSDEAAAYHFVKYLLGETNLGQQGYYNLDLKSEYVSNHVSQISNALKKASDICRKLVSQESIIFGSETAGIQLPGQGSMGLSFQSSSGVLNNLRKLNPKLEEILKMSEDTLGKLQSAMGTNMALKNQNEMFKNIENQIKAWISKWKEIGLNIPSYEDMLNKVKLDLLREQEEAEKARLAALNKDVQAELPKPVEEKKKLNPLLLVGAGVAAFIAMKD